MKAMKITLSFITIFFAGLGAAEILSYDITNPAMLISLATLLLLRGVEYRNDRNKSAFMLLIILALFVYVVVVYNVFIG